MTRRVCDASRRSDSGLCNWQLKLSSWEWPVTSPESRPTKPGSPGRAEEMSLHSNKVGHTCPQKSRSILSPMKTVRRRKAPCISPASCRNLHERMRIAFSFYHLMHGVSGEQGTRSKRRAGKINHRISSPLTYFCWRRRNGSSM